MEASERLANSCSILPVKNNSQPVTTEVNRASQELVISSNDEFHWCAEMDYQFAWYGFSIIKFLPTLVRK